jgi:hypothetical protein
MRFLIATLVLTFATPALAQTGDVRLDAQLAANLARGDDLYAYDQSAWHVADAMMAAVPDATKKLMRGYITTPDAGGYRTTFYGGDGSERYRLYSALWTWSAVTKAQIFPAADKVAVTAEEARLIAAKDIAVGIIHELGFCSDDPPNVAVIPGATSADPISIYLMTPQSETGAFPLGGHNRIDVKDGRIVSKRAFTKGCITLAPKPKGGEKTTAMVVTHLLDPVPTEIHAFTVHTSGLPLGVGMPDGAMYWLSRKDGKIVATREK